MINEEFCDQRKQRKFLYLILVHKLVTISFVLEIYVSYIYNKIKWRSETCNCEIFVFHNL